MSSLRDSSFKVGQFANAVCGLIEKAKDAGAASVDESDSSVDFADAIREVGKGRLGEHFLMTMPQLAPSRIRWTSARNAAGEIIAVVGARRDTVAGWDLQRTIRENWEGYYKGDDGNPVRFAKDSCHYARQFSGDFAYIGDGWVRQDAREKDLLAEIQKLLIISVFNEWRPQLAYGWMRPNLVERGLAVRWGYSLCYRNGITWDKPPAQSDLRELYFVGCDRPGVRCLIESEAAEFSLRNQKNNT
jgi:hypothetical protein